MEMVATETISYGLNYWSPTVILFSLFLAQPPLKDQLPILKDNTDRIVYFNPANCSYCKAVFSDEEKTNIVFSFAQKLMADSREIDPSIYQVLLDNRKNLLL